MRAGEVLDAQRDLIERIEGTKFRDIMAYFAGSQFGSEDGKVGRDTSGQSGVTNYTALDVLTRQLKAAEAYRVSHDMCQMIEFAASQLEDLDRFDASLAPTGCGIVCLDKPLPVVDVRGRTMLIHWMVWGPGAMTQYMNTPGTIIWEFNDIWRQPDEVEDFFQDTTLQQHGKEFLEDVNHRRGRWGTVGTQVAWQDQRLGPKILDASEEQAARIIADGDTPIPGTNSLRYIMAMWMLMDQTVTRAEIERPDRPAMKRARKARLPQEVTVIRLRREDADYEPTDGHSLVEWRHRWIVRGHWRWQACGAGRQERKRIWINPFVKGPENAPIKQSKKVYSIER